MRNTKRICEANMQRTNERMALAIIITTVTEWLDHEEKRTVAAETWQRCLTYDFVKVDTFSANKNKRNTNTCEQKH